LEKSVKRPFRYNRLKIIHLEKRKVLEKALELVKN